MRGLIVEKDQVTISAIDCKRVVFGSFRKAGSAVSDPQASLIILPRRFYTRYRPFVRLWSVARVRKKYDCFAVYLYDNWIIQL